MDELGVRIARYQAEHGVMIWVDHQAGLWRCTGPGVDEVSWGAEELLDYVDA